MKFPHSKHHTTQIKSTKIADPQTPSVTGKLFRRKSTRYFLNLLIKLVKLKTATKGREKLLYNELIRSGREQDSVTLITFGGSSPCKLNETPLKLSNVTKSTPQWTRASLSCSSVNSSPLLLSPRDTERLPPPLREWRSATPWQERATRGAVHERAQKEEKSVFSRIPVPNNQDQCFRGWRTV